MSSSTTQQQPRSNKVVCEDVQFNCYLTAAPNTTPEARLRAFKIISGQALCQQMRAQSVKNKRRTERTGEDSGFVYFDEAIVRAYDANCVRIERGDEENTNMIFISTDDEDATKYLRNLVLLDLKWATSGGNGQTSRPTALVKVQKDMVGHVIGKRASNLLNIRDSQRWAFVGMRKKDMAPVIFYDEQLGGFVVAANDAQAVNRMKLMINNIVRDVKSKTWAKRGKSSGGGGAKTSTTTTGNGFEALMSDSDEDSEDSDE